jgi:hypothetical protein
LPVNAGILFGGIRSVDSYPDTATSSGGPKPSNYNSLGPGTFIFAGTTVQSISGPNSFANLTIDNSSGLMVNSDTKVTGTLTLTNGLIILGSSNLILGSSATVAGTPSANSMIVATGTGQLMKTFTGTGSFIYPVGDNTGTTEYSPVTLAFTSGTFGTDANVGVNLVNAKYPYDSITGNYINRYWTITQQNTTGFSCNATFQYLAADIVGTESQIYCEKVNLLPIVEYSLANTITHQLTATGLTSFSTFTGNRAQYKYLALKCFLEGLYIGSGTMRAARDQVGPHWGSSVADHITVELHDPVTYATIKYTANNLALSTNGNASVIIPRAFSGNYYVTVKNRNSLETVTAAPMLVNTTTLNYDFSTAKSKAYGNNLKSLSGGVFGIYSGDINSVATPYPSAPVQDGVIDLLDDYYIYASFLNGDYGYLSGDLNGDGVVDLVDDYIAYANFLLGIYKITP